jgi:hypothetical protein
MRRMKNISFIGLIKNKTFKVTVCLTAVSVFLQPLDLAGIVFS